MAEFWDIVDEKGRPTGRIHQKGKPMKAGEFHLSVSVWILNSRGEFLISKRVHKGTDPSMWHTTGGGAICGETSLAAVLREAKEELGVTLLPQNGSLYKSYTYPHSDGSGAAYIEVWIFRQDVELSELVLQSSEICGAVWATEKQIREMAEKGLFLPYDYLEDLFEKTRSVLPAEKR